MKKLILGDLHREEAPAFSEAWGVELPCSYCDEPGREYAALHDSVGLLDESYRGVLDVAGDDAAAFLDKVVSSPSLQLVDGSGQDSCLLSAKGRLLGAFTLYRLGASHFRAVLGEPVREALLESLRKYAFLSEIEVSDVSSEVCLLGLRGPGAAGVLEAAGCASLPGVFEVSSFQLDGARVECAGAAQQGAYELWIPSDLLVESWGRLRGLVEDAGGLCVGWEAAEAERIEAGIASCGRDYEDEYFPAEVNEEARLSYDKCYVGQEVVARMRTYGHANRKLVQLSAPGGGEIVGGSLVYSDSVEAGRVGTVCYSFARSSPLALAIIHRKFFNSKSLQLENGEPAEVTEVCSGAE
ncbi:MAG: hypothetical protein VX254_09205 [Planctomycetota bacterium]|nr:hypothetical protein [Planctomycetota bacterium]